MAEVRRPPSTDEETGLDRAFRYVYAAIHRGQGRFGREADDMSQEILKRWMEQCPEKPPRFSRLLNRESAEYRLFREVVKKVLDQAKWKWRSEKWKLQKYAEFIRGTIDKEPDKALIILDMAVDLAIVLKRLTARQRRILEYRRKGNTFEEIAELEGISLGLAHTEYHGALEKAKRAARGRPWL